MTPEHHGYAHLGTFAIPGKCKSKSNEKLPNGRLSNEMRAWEDGVALLAKVAIGAGDRSAGWIVIQMWCANKKHIDFSNSPKSILDGIVKGGVFKDDKYLAVTVLPAKYGYGDKTVISVWGKPNEP